jgi:hypothetical protein
VNKKEAKKLRLPVGVGKVAANAQSKQKFFGSFFQKRTAISFTVSVQIQRL